MKLRSFYCYSINHVPFIFPLLPEHVYLVVVMDGRRSERVPSFDVTSFRATFEIGALNSLTAELCAIRATTRSRLLFLCSRWQLHICQETYHFQL